MSLPQSLIAIAMIIIITIISLFDEGTAAMLTLCPCTTLQYSYELVGGHKRAKCRANIGLKTFMELIAGCVNRQHINNFIFVGDDMSAFCFSSFMLLPRVQ